MTHGILTGGPPLTTVTVAFGSPTYFSQNGAVVTLPDPRLVVGSWRRRWNSSLDGAESLAVGDEAWGQTLRALQLTEFDLRTGRQDNGYGSEHAGFTGSLTIRLARNAPAVSKAVLGTLARFAEYSGTGAQTTHGFGATTVIPTARGASR